MAGQMCWLSTYGTDGEKVLHLRLHSHQPWSPYTTMSLHVVSEASIPGSSIQMSRGWATFQKLIKEGWVLIPTDQAYKSSKMAS